MAVSGAPPRTQANSSAGSLTTSNLESEEEESEEEESEEEENEEEEIENHSERGASAQSSDTDTGSRALDSSSSAEDDEITDDRTSSYIFDERDDEDIYIAKTLHPDSALSDGGISDDSHSDSSSLSLAYQVQKLTSDLR